MIETYKLSVDGTKYTFVMYEDDWRIHVLRYGNPWLIIDKGHNAIFSLLYEAIEAKDELAKLQIVHEASKVSSPMSDKEENDDADELEMHPANPEW